jgi:hypothetical protein
VTLNLRTNHHEAMTTRLAFERSNSRERQSSHMQLMAYGIVDPHTAAPPPPPPSAVRFGMVDRG